MGRGRGRGKKQTNFTGRDDFGSGEEEKVLASKRRGRQHKISEGVVEEVELIDNDKSTITGKNSEDQIIVADSGTKRRKRVSQVKEESDVAKKENGLEGNGTEEKPVGFRQNGSRRKSKPRRAAEAGVECQ